MRFVARTIWGGLIVAACAAVLWFGVSSFSEARQGANDARPKRPAPERVFTVRNVLLEPVTAMPVLTAYGEIAARRILELRAATAGRIVDIAPHFREGAAAEVGETLLRVDPATTESRQADMLAVLAEARSAQSEAEESLSLTRADLEAAIRQANLRRNAYDRQKQLFDRGVASAAAVENAQLALAGAEQTVASRRSAYASAKQRVQAAATAVQRAEISLGDARRDLADTAVTAPFGGLLTEVDATLGRLVTPNEKLADLIDLRSLEAAFRVTDAQYARLIGEDGALLPLNATVTLNLGDREVAARAVLDRPAATVGAEGGRVIYAKIEAADETPLRPGDFVTVTVEEPPLEQVAEIPARAASEDGRVLVIGEDGRLSEKSIDILRRRPETLIVGGVPFGEKIVAERRPQLGPGVLTQSPEDAARKEAETKAAKADYGKARGGKSRP